MSTPETENFANAPVTLGERRADRNKDASAWAPRDVLINLLRDIDSGAVSPNSLFVTYTEPDPEGGFTTSWSAASPSKIHTLGMLSLVQKRL